MTIEFNTLNSTEAYKAFLIQYHQLLNKHRAFPPLGIQKALHTAAPIFGYEDWHKHSAALGATQDPIAAAMSKSQYTDFLIGRIFESNAYDSNEALLKAINDACNIDVNEQWGKAKRAFNTIAQNAPFRDNAYGMLQYKEVPAFIASEVNAYLDAMGVKQKDNDHNQSSNTRLPSTTSSTRELTIKVQILGDYESLSEDDQVFYDSLQDGQETISVPSHLEEGQAAGVALDIFHQTNPINIPEDFSIVVWVEGYGQIFEDSDYEAYSHKVSPEGIAAAATIAPSDLRSIASVLEDMPDVVTSKDESDNSAVIAGHEITWWARHNESDKAFYTTSLDDASIEHLQSKLVDGYVSGEVHISVYTDLSDDPVEFNGWWKKA